MYNTYVGGGGAVHQPPSWFDSTVELPVHSELGTRDQANILRLDPYEEMAWVGTQRGRLLSYLVSLESGHSAYSRFNVGVKEERIIHILPKPEGVISLTRSDVLFNNRGGVGHQLVSRKALARMTAAGPLSAAEQFPHHNLQLAVGTGDTAKTLFYLDSMHGELTTFFDLPHSVSQIHCCRENPLLVIGGSNGQVSLVDGRVPRVTSTLQSAHPCEITSIASSFNYIFTCGKRDGSRVAGGLGSPQSVVADVFLKVFDIRNLKQPIPVSCPNGAVKVEVASSSPGGSVTLLVLSNHGLWQQGELYPNSSQMLNLDVFKTECYQPHSPDLSPTVVDWSVRGDMNAMMDSSGVVHFWCRSASAEQHYPYRVNGEAGSLNQILIPPRQPVMPSLPRVLHAGNRESVLDSTAATRVYSDSVRDGSWMSWMEHVPVEDEELFYSGKSHPLRAPLPILPVVGSNCKEWDRTLSYCRNAMGLQYGTLAALARASVKRDSRSSPFRPKHAAIGELELDDVLLDEDESEPATAGKRWKFTQVDYSINHSLFPFAIYNKSGYRSGLENGQGSLDCLNAIIQCLYNITQLKAGLKAHSCADESCLSCELGFLFHMMDESRFSRNRVCQPVRVSRVWRRLAGESSSVFNIFEKIVQQLVNEGVAPSVMSGLFGDRTTPPIDITPHSVAGSVDPRAAILIAKISGATSLLPDELFIDPATGEVSTQESAVRFELISVVANVTAGGGEAGAAVPTPRNQSGLGSHSVAIVSVTDDLNTEKPGTRSRAHSVIFPSPSPTATIPVEEQLTPAVDETASSPEWLLFNDFVVTRSSVDEAVRSCKWRRPVIAVYACRDRLAAIPTPAVPSSPISVETFRQDENLAMQNFIPENRTFEPLKESEIEQILRGDFTVALDTEFISLGLAAIEIREDGSREIGKPGDMAVGRVSVLRVKPGDPLDGVPFMDHYIAMDEREIKDYVTRFSGIRPGDLDPATSTHWLTSSKSVYQKLRFLVDSGCKFVGHGLHTDFRIINLWVASSALIDTVELFHLPGQRFLSLKFLANRLLEKSIQGDVHCSIEDARTAMEIYRVYLRLKAEGTLEQTIKGLYESGRSLGWK